MKNNEFEIETEAIVDRPDGGEPCIGRMVTRPGEASFTGAHISRGSEEGAMSQWDSIEAEQRFSKSPAFVVLTWWYRVVVRAPEGSMLSLVISRDSGPEGSLRQYQIRILQPLALAYGLFATVTTLMVGPIGAAVAALSDDAPGESSAVLPLIAFVSVFWLCSMCEVLYIMFRTVPLLRSAHPDIQRSELLKVIPGPNHLRASLCLAVIAGVGASASLILTNSTRWQDFAVSATLALGFLLLTYRSVDPRNSDQTPI